MRFTLLAIATASATTKERFEFFHAFNLGGFCDGSGLTKPADLDPDFGYVTFSVKDDTISARIKIKNAFDASVSVYSIRLIQGEADCHTGFTEVSLPKGKDTITISEPVTSDFAFVHIDQREVPCCIINSSLVTETFRH
jgi:hypothetical protein